MNARRLKQMGVPEDCLRPAVQACAAAAQHGWRGALIRDTIKSVIDDPASFTDDEHFGAFASALIEEQETVHPDAIDYAVWGEDGIDSGSHKQMRQACRIPGAVGAALMPDAHVGYGLPIGGVLATEGVVIPYAVGVDIACRMKLSILDAPVEGLAKQFDRHRHALEKGTRFGVGSAWARPQEHAVMDRDWSITAVTRENKDKAWKQLGTSGSGNHFVEFGVLSLAERDEDLGLDAGAYVALLSHSGSRGAGAAVCRRYSDIARAQLPRKFDDMRHLAWLDLDSEAGAEYWAAMNLMGEYAAANHAVIHKNVVKILGARVIAGVENHHNFAWNETHGGREVIVHRKGATPASAGELGVIPGSMADPAYVVRGKGHPESLRSASHGAGRQLSRTKAKEKYNFRSIQKTLEARGVRVLSAGADEVPGVYKNIDDVMGRQRDLVDTVARFDPKIVKMCGDGSRAED